MNDIFWEIVEQADEQGGDDPDIRDQVFAKLLLQECLKVINQSNGVGDDDVIKISRDVKSHFGLDDV